MISIHYGQELQATLLIRFYIMEMKRRIFQLLHFNIIILYLTFFVIICEWNVFICMQHLCLWCVECMQTHLLSTYPFVVGCHLFLIRIKGSWSLSKQLLGDELEYDMGTAAKPLEH